MSQTQPTATSTVPWTTGLAHLGLTVQDLETSVRFFAPELAGKGPGRHLMVRLPGSGIRVEFRSKG